MTRGAAIIEERLEKARAALARHKRNAAERLKTKPLKWHSIGMHGARLQHKDQALSVLYQREGDKVAAIALETAADLDGDNDAEQLQSLFDAHGHHIIGVFEDAEGREPLETEVAAKLACREYAEKWLQDRLDGKAPEPECGCDDIEDEHDERDKRDKIVSDFLDDFLDEPIEES